ncbi:hypothetical protein SAMN05444920_101708 [Nonomuraea solani]|uniref:YbaB/EbfC DNA-binding family protein n=1 Tax=Nonomuraea solani TaxID=1144553 RepID=A0A1H5UZH1_9ACTN|nr:hypothetical protein [Nonomuraea solani]SEF80376.1 hypothetical protein SAMN05444920_101708 [Nonomuraea solani]
MMEEAIDRLIADAQRPADGLDALYQQMLTIKGIAQDPDKLVTVECSSEGVTGLEIDPRAMRWGSQRLSATILTLIAGALVDMQAKSAALLGDALGEGPLDLAAENNPADVHMREAGEAYEAAMDQAMAELSRIQRDLER